MLEEPQQIVELAVDVATDLDGRLELEERRLRSEDLRGLLDQKGDLVARQAHIGARLFCDSSETSGF